MSFAVSLPRRGPYAFRNYWQSQLTTKKRGMRSPLWGALIYLKAASSIGFANREQRGSRAKRRSSQYMPKGPFGARGLPQRSNNNALALWATKRWQTPLPFSPVISEANTVGIYLCALYMPHSAKPNSFQTKKRPTTCLPLWGTRTEGASAYCTFRCWRKVGALYCLSLPPRRAEALWAIYFRKAGPEGNRLRPPKGRKAATRAPKGQTRCSCPFGATTRRPSGHILLLPRRGNPRFIDLKAVQGRELLPL